MSRYYHVIMKQGLWHLYAGNAITSLMAERDQAMVLRAARALARHDGARVVVHKASAHELEEGRSQQLSDFDRMAASPPATASVEKIRPL